MSEAGRLVLVATPIGNLGDLSPRAVEALKGAHAVVCEDTRRTGRLFKHLGFASPRLIVANEHTEWTARADVLQLLATGSTVCVVTDAGTPAISDPGAALVRAAIDQGHRVETIPGPVAAIAALVISGLPTDRFAVEGFLPRTGSERRERIAALATDRAHTVVLYEAPHRLARTLTDLSDALGPDRRVVLARELTKLHEETWRGTLAEAMAYTNDREPRGEYVIVIDRGADTEPMGDDALTARLTGLFGEGLTRRDAVDRVVADTGVARNRVYRLALHLETPGPN